MRKIVLLLLTALLFSFITGCAAVEETIAGERPEKIYEDIWVIQEKSTQMEIIDEEATLTAFGSINYMGTSSVQEVSIIIKSPLVADIIADDQVQKYDTVNAGDLLEYVLDCHSSDFRKKVPLGTNDDNLIEDFKNNSYFEVSWKEDGETYNVKFFNWDSDRH